MAKGAVRTIDPKCRVTLPRSFAGATVLIEQVNESEVRIRKVRIVPEGEFLEETPCVLSNAERDQFLALLDNPPEPTEALKKVLKKPRRKR